MMSGLLLSWMTLAEKLRIEMHAERDENSAENKNT